MGWIHVRLQLTLGERERRRLRAFFWLDDNQTARGKTQAGREQGKGPALETRRKAALQRRGVTAKASYMAINTQANGRDANLSAR